MGNDVNRCFQFLPLPLQTSPHELMQVFYHLMAHLVVSVVGHVHQQDQQELLHVELLLSILNRSNSYTCVLFDRFPDRMLT